MIQVKTIMNAAEADRPGLIQLLKAAGLPTEDLPPSLQYFILAKEEEKVVGSVGLEIYNSYALLRSLAVDASQRGQGLGKKLYQQILESAREKDIKEVYLITTTADKFFAKKGFVNINRSEAPTVIRQTAQFASVCPSSAVVMKLTVA